MKNRASDIYFRQNYLTFLVSALFQVCRNLYIKTWSKKQSLCLVVCIFLGAEGLDSHRISLQNNFVSLAILLHGKRCSQFSYTDFLQCWENGLNEKTTPLKFLWLNILVYYTGFQLWFWGEPQYIVFSVCEDDLADLHNRAVPVTCKWHANKLLLNTHATCIIYIINVFN